VRASKIIARWRQWRIYRMADMARNGVNMLARMAHGIGISIESIVNKRSSRQKASISVASCGENSNNQQRQRQYSVLKAWRA